MELALKVPSSCHSERSEVTGSANETRQDGFTIRRATLKFNIPYTTTIAGAIALSKAVTVLKRKNLNIKSVQEYHKN